MDTRTTRRLFVSLVLGSMPTAIAGDWQAREVEYPAHFAFVEFCMPVEKGQVLELELQATDRLDFNVHFHTDTDTLYPVRERIEGQVAFNVPVQVTGEYCLMWQSDEERDDTTFIHARYRAH